MIWNYHWPRSKQEHPEIEWPSHTDSPAIVSDPPTNKPNRSEGIKELEKSRKCRLVSGIHNAHELYDECEREQGYCGFRESYAFGVFNHSISAFRTLLTNSQMPSALCHSLSATSGLPDYPFEKEPGKQRLSYVLVFSFRS